MLQELGKTTINICQAFLFPHLRTYNALEMVIT